MIFFISIGILIASFELSLRFSIKSSGKVLYFSKQFWLYNFVYCPPLSCIYFVPLFKCVNIFNINVHCHFICLCLSLFFNINLHGIASLRFCSDGFIKTPQPPPNCQYLRVFWCFSQSSLYILNHIFPFK